MMPLTIVIFEDDSYSYRLLRHMLQTINPSYEVVGLLSSVEEGRAFFSYHQDIDFIIANEDAFTCAMEYGSISGTIYNVLGWMGVLFNVKLKTIDIVPGFAMKESRWDAAGKLCVRPITAVIAGIQFLITYSIRYFIPYKLQERKLNKHAARQK